jgi:arabinose-5-phosphate isomerase
MLTCADRLGPELNDLIDQIFNLKGRVILSGMGKSGHIANKVAATLSSTGTPSISIHPSESLHGDLGMVTSDDLVIFISKSGENPELNLMIPSLKRMTVPTVALTCNGSSSLAKMVDVVINLGDVEEICPLDLAPTTSSTLCLVLLDSMAMELMKLREFSAQEYALFHPGGRLGRRLLFSVSDLMSNLEQCAVLEQDTPMLDVLHAMTEAQMGCALIVKNNNLVGLITDSDVRKALDLKEAFFNMKASDICNASPTTCIAEDNAYEVLLKMRQREKPVTLMPVVDQNRQAKGLLRLEVMVQQGLV